MGCQRVTERYGALRDATNGGPTRRALATLMRNPVDPLPVNRESTVYTTSNIATNLVER